MVPYDHKVIYIRLFELKDHARVVSYLSSTEFNIVSTCIFEILDVQIQIYIDIPR